jgi:hypothetical protein
MQWNYAGIFKGARLGLRLLADGLKTGLKQVECSFWRDYTAQSDLSQLNSTDSEMFRIATTGRFSVELS